ncbi:MAG: hypothetical protein NZ949_00985, partial [Candidatus Kapabacteria bacterium]|nr:hypothetical protein [Candidatus Kapabacteria bacterium]MDW7997634.1 hypothetical protein [Bacteroidota bacterium]
KGSALTRFPSPRDTSAADSLALPSPWDELQEQLLQQTVLEQRLRDSLDQLRRVADSLRSTIEHLHDALRKWQRLADSARIQHYEAFAQIYNGAPASEVARIMEQLPPQEAAMILKAMNRRQAARVIAALSPEHAAAVLTSPTGENRR